MIMSCNMSVDERIPYHVTQMDKWSSHIGGCKTEETVRKGCGTNTNELQSIESKDCLPCCLLLLYEYDGECRGLSLEDDMTNQPVSLGNIICCL